MLRPAWPDRDHFERHARAIPRLVRRRAQGKLGIPDEVCQNACGYRYVFICGLFHEHMPGYFLQNVKELRARGVPRTSIHLVKPDSQQTVDENCKSVRAELQAIVKQGPERLVLIGHSRGACDALVFALQNPTFVKEHIHPLFLIQGPFGGTAVADYVAGDGTPMDRRMPTGYRFMGQAMGRLESRLLEDDTHDAIASLNRKDSESFWKDALTDPPRGGPGRRPQNLLCNEPDRSVASSALPARDGVVPGHVLRAERWTGRPGGPVAARPGHGSRGSRRRPHGPDPPLPRGSPKPRLRNALIDAIIMAVGTQNTQLARRSGGTTARTVDSDVKQAHGSSR